MHIHESESMSVMEMTNINHLLTVTNHCQKMRCQMLMIRMQVTNSVDGISSRGVWSTIAGNFQTRMTISKERYPELNSDLKHASSQLDIFLKMFPYSLFIQISYYTNRRLTIYGNAKKRAYSRGVSYWFFAYFGAT